MNGKKYISGLKAAEKVSRPKTIVEKSDQSMPWSTNQNQVLQNVV